MSYRETLYKWAAGQIPVSYYSADYGKHDYKDLPTHTLKTVTSVTVVQEPGYQYSEYTGEDPRVDVTVNYVCHCGHQMSREVDVESMGDLLTQLFAIEDTP